MLKCAERSRVDGLIKICSRIGFKTADAEAYLIQNKMSCEAVTEAAIGLLDAFRFEVDSFKCENGRKPMSGETVSDGFSDLFAVLLCYGLDPNAVYCEDGRDLNLLNELFLIDNYAVMRRIYRLLFENGADPNVKVGGESFFEKVDSDVVILAPDYGAEHREAYEAAFRVWLLCIAYGATLPSGANILKMKCGNSTEIFKECERFSYRIEYASDDWYLHIFYTDSGEEVAVL